jgi:ectoine hydroxylase-related dioxygenase (phytanoyl-CoA dioxygenase family)
MWSVWFPLADTPLEVGPLGIVPGSHKKVWPHLDRWKGIGVSNEVTWATQPVYPGDIVAYGASTVHCAWSNVSENSVRLALDVRYEPVGTPNSVLRSSSRI